MFYGIMTLPDLEDRIVMDLPKKQLDTAETIHKIMLESFEQNRLSCGVCDCAHQLELDPDHVMICILPEIAAQNVPVRIQHTLIEAYCRENGISVLKIGSEEKFSKMFQNKDSNISSQHNLNNSNKEHAPLERKYSNTRDFSCFLIMRPDIMSSAEQFLKSFCDDAWHGADFAVEIPSS